MNAVAFVRLPGQGGCSGRCGRWVVRLGIRTVPWLIAAASLGIPLLAGGFAGWPYVVLWVILLIVPWIVTRDQPASRRERLVLPVFLLPMLLVLGFIGGWYLIRRRRVASDRVR